MDDIDDEPNRLEMDAIGADGTTVGGGGPTGSGGGLLSPGAASSPLARKYKQWYLGIPCRLLHLFVCVATFILIIATMADKGTAQWWYHLLEFTVMILFAAEVGTSIFFLRGRYFEEWINCFECFICVICTLSYLLVVAHVIVQKEEHEAIFVLRYIGQLMRMTMFCRLAVAEHATANRKQLSDFRPQLVYKEDSDDDLDYVDRAGSTGSGGGIGGVVSPSLAGGAQRSFSQGTPSPTLLAAAAPSGTPTSSAASPASMSGTPPASFLTAARKPLGKSI